MKSLSGLLGWTLLVAALAVPSFLFYNWWSKNKAPEQIPAAGPAAAGQIFAKESQQAPALPAAAPDPSPRPVPRNAPAGVVSSTSAAQMSPELQRLRDEIRAKVSASTAVPAGQAQPAAPQRQGQASVAVSTAPKQISYFNPKVPRDPTLSPEEYAKLREEEEARKEAVRQQRMSEMRRRRESGPENKILLQGVVGNSAIINNDMYSVGNTVRGVGAKVVRIGANYVIFEFKGKQFKKVIQ